MAGTNISNKKRLTLLFYFSMFFFLIIIGKLIQLMFLDAADLSDLAESQWTRELSVAPKRGSILDRNGEVLAASATAESVLLYPKDIEDPGEIANLLAPILGMDEQQIYEIASDKSKVDPRAESGGNRLLFRYEAVLSIRRVYEPGFGLHDDRWRRPGRLGKEI